MASKKSTDVMIAGKVYTLSGYEEEGYLQRVASYINAKISEITEHDEFRRISNEMKAILIELNIADDYFKAKTKFETIEEDYKKAEKELFDLKHELVDTQMKVEELLEKLELERQEKSQKTEREQTLEEKYEKLENKYQLLLQNAKTADEKNRQFEEILHLSQQENRELEAVNKELRLNKEKLEAALADALLGAGGQEEQEHLSKNDLRRQALSAAEPVPVMAELSEEELTELLAPAAIETEHEEPAQPKETSKAPAGQTDSKPLPEEAEGWMDFNLPPKEAADQDQMEELFPKEAADQDQMEELFPKEAADETDLKLQPTEPADRIGALLDESTDRTDLEPLPKEAAEQADELPMEDNLKQADSKAPEPEYRSVITEISEEDDPELQEIARQIMELERQEMAEKSKKNQRKNRSKKK